MGRISWWHLSPSCTSWDPSASCDFSADGDPFASWGGVELLSISKKKLVANIQDSLFICLELSLFTYQLLYHPKLVSFNTNNLLLMNGI